MVYGLWLTGDAKMDKSEEGGCEAKRVWNSNFVNFVGIERLTNALNALNVVANCDYRHVVCNPWMS